MGKTKLTEEMVNSIERALEERLPGRDRRTIAEEQAEQAEAERRRGEDRRKLES